MKKAEKSVTKIINDLFNKYTPIYRRRDALLLIYDSERIYKKEIKYSLKHSEVFGPKLSYVEPKHKFQPKFTVNKLDTISAAKSYLESSPNAKICILNFANYIYPGGGFIRGAKAQEEDICRDSFLYNILVNNTSFYEWNKANINHGMYKDRAIYSPDIYIGIGTTIDHPDGKVDVLTCAAPNKYNPENKDTILNERALWYRITFIKNILALKQPDIFIAGAFGCGAFGQDPFAVADDFKYIFEKESPVPQIVFAIPGGQNYDVFKKVYDQN